MKEYSAQTSLNRNRQDYSDFKHLFSKGEWATLRKTWRGMLARCMNYADPNKGLQAIQVAA